MKTESVNSLMYELLKPGVSNPSVASYAAKKRKIAEIPRRKTQYFLPRQLIRHQIPIHISSEPKNNNYRTSKVL